MTIPECNILRDILRVPESRPDIFEQVEADDFPTPQCRDKYKWLLKLAGKDHNRLDHFDTQVQILQDEQLAEMVNSADHRDHWDTIPALIDHARKAKVVRAASAAGRAAVDATLTADEVQEELDKVLGAARDERTNDGELPVPQVVANVYKKALQSANGDNPYVTWGFGPLDAQTPLERPCYCIVAARPAVGKTAFAVSMAIRQLNAKVSVGLIGLEMTAEQYTRRFLSQLSGISYRDLSEGRPFQEENQMLARACADMNKYPLRIHAGKKMDIAQIKAKARQWVKRDGVQVIYIDYVQLIRCKGIQGRVEQIEFISSELLDIKNELGVPIVALAQLNRDGHGTAPNMAMLKGSGALEQDAEVVILLDRPHSTNPPADRLHGRPTMVDTCAVIVDKSRNSAIGTVFMAFNPINAAFGDTWQRVEYD